MYCKYCGKIVESDSIYCKYCGRFIDDTTTRLYDIYPEICWIDLGLSVKWANCNLGAVNSTDLGFYFSWYDYEIKKTLEIHNLTCHGSMNRDSYQLFHKIIVEDKAHIPSELEWEELLNKCKWVLSDDALGYYVVGPNENFIYLPFSGSLINDEIVDTENGAYWTSEEGFSSWGVAFYANKEHIGLNYGEKFTGINVRLVKK